MIVIRFNMVVDSIWIGLDSLLLMVCWWLMMMIALVMMMFDVCGWWWHVLLGFFGDYRSE